MFSALQKITCLVGLPRKIKPIVELIQNAKRPMCRVEATFAKYEYKNLLKKRNYRWHDPDNGNKDDKAWCKLISHEDMDTEREWLNDNVYNNNFQGRFIEISIMDKYKSRSLCNLGVV